MKIKRACGLYDDFDITDRKESEKIAKYLLELKKFNQSKYSINQELNKSQKEIKSEYRTEHKEELKNIRRGLFLNRRRHTGRYGRYNYESPWRDLIGMVSLEIPIKIFIDNIREYAQDMEEFNSQIPTHDTFQEKLNNVGYDEKIAIDNLLRYAKYNGIKFEKSDLIGLSPIAQKLLEEVTFDVGMER